jgi:hypothetical protein
VDGGVAIQCEGPAQCGGNPCCLNLFNDYLIESVACTTSASSCPPSSDQAMTMVQTRGCKYDGDCTSGLPSTNAFPDCCHLAGNMVRVCYNKNIGNTFGGTIVCP